MDMGYLAGIDLGTSSVKVLIMDPDGRTLAVSSRGYDVMTPKMSYAEQEPQVWWDCTVMAIREAMEKSGIRPEELDGTMNRSCLPSYGWTSALQKRRP